MFNPLKSKDSALNFSLVAIGGLCCFMLGLYLYLGQQARVELEQILPHELSAVEGDIKRNFNGASEFLVALSEDLETQRLDESSFQRRAASYAAKHPEVVRIEWSNAHFFYHDIFPHDGNQGDLGSLITIDQPETALRAAQRTRRPVFSSVYLAPDARRAVSLFVPIYFGDRFDGAFSILFSLDSLLSDSLPKWAKDKYDVSLVDGKNQIVSRLSSGKPLVRGLSAKGGIDLTEESLYINLRPYSTGMDWQQVALFILGMSVLIGVAFAIYELTAEVRRRKLTGEKLAEAKELAETANAAKSQFVASVSHEMRTPLGALLGYADLILKSDETSEDTLRCLHAIRRNGQNLLQLINDLLDLSKLEAGLLDVNKEEFSLLKIFEELAQTFYNECKVKNLDLILESDGLVPERILSDEAKLRQILTNLIGNAVKFTEQGSVRVSVSVRVTGNHPMLNVVVADSGIGMTEQQKQRLFQSFSQGDSTITKRFGGTGLGLAISKKLATLLQGNLVLTYSEPQRGSVFTLSLDPGPLENMAFVRLKINAEKLLSDVASRGAEKDDVKRLRGLSVLVAEDGFDNQIIIREYLENAGATVIVARDGIEAVEMAQVSQTDVILMDVQMPELDGYQATRQIRAMGYSVPVIALTANAMLGERERCMAAGCNDYLTKPLDAEKLFSMILQQTRLNGGQKANERATEVSSALMSTLADDPRVLNVLEQFLGRLPLRIEALNEAAEERKWGKLAKLAHTLRGTVGNYGYPTMALICQQLEDLAATGAPDEEECEQLLRELGDLSQRAQFVVLRDGFH